MNRATYPWLPIAGALVKEFYALKWRAIVFSLAGPLVFLVPILGLAATSDPDQSFGRTEAGVMLHFALFWSVIGTCGTALLIDFAEPRRRYPMPATSLLLVCVPMVCAMLTIFAQYAMIATVLNLMFDAGWPVLAPGLLAAVLMALALAVTWSTSNSQILQGLACLAAGGITLAAVVIFGKPHGAETGSLFRLSGGFLTFFALAVPACIILGTLGFDRLRHGAGWEMQRLVDTIIDYSPFRSRTAPGRYTSAPSAQFWLEWTERGALLPAGTAVIAFVLVVFLSWAVSKEQMEVALSISSTWLIFLPVVGLFLGHRSATGEFGSYAGSRPCSDPQLASAVLKSATLSLVLSALIWLVCLGLIVLLQRSPLEQSVWHELMLDPGPTALIARAALGLTAAWSVTCLIASLSMAARRVLGTAFALGFGSWLGIFVLSLLLPRAERPTFQRYSLLVCLFIGLALTVATFLIGWRKRLLSNKTLATALALLLSAIGLGVLSGLLGDPRFRLLLLAGCGLLPVPLAAAPLAVWFNRHR